MEMVESDVLDLVEGEDNAVRGMDDDDLQAIVAGEIDDAADYIDNTVSTERAYATDYYWGRPFGNEEDGRSQVVSYDVRDTVQAIMPSLMRVFFAGDTVVEFVPQGAKDVMFITLEDETGVANLVVFPSVYEKNRRNTLTARLMACKGKVESAEGVIHVIVEQVAEINAWLTLLTDTPSERPEAFLDKGRFFH